MAQLQAITICQFAELADNSVRMFETLLPEQEKPFRILVLREGEGVRGFENRCPHFGVPLATTQAHLIFQPGISLTCNTHYARFRWDDGLCDRGDCLGESLNPLVLRRIGDDVVLDVAVSQR
jgi:nitrite reductase/ring-hydroxylating ferredoxin subunit